VAKARRLVEIAILATLGGCGSGTPSPASLPARSPAPSPESSPAQSPAPDAGQQPDSQPADIVRVGGVPDASSEAPSVAPSDAPPDPVMADGRSGDATGVVDGTTLADVARPLRCNGYEALCDRRFDEVVFPATHNSMANADDLWFAPNQEHGIARQLQDGIRAFLIDTYAWNGDLYLCHTVCELGSRLLVDSLRDIATFLRGNPDEVLTLIIEDHISAADTERAFTQSGLLEWAYVHAPGTTWPTLREMIAGGDRLLVTAENGRPPPAWYQNIWDLASDTPYSFKSAQEFSCALNRGARDNDLFLLNHWVENPLPSPILSASVNTSSVLLGRARDCQTERGKLPNFVAVNHYATGDLFPVVRQLNGLPP
jgi:hypothetical protein